MRQSWKLPAVILGSLAIGLAGADEPKKARYYFERGVEREQAKDIEGALDDYSRAVTFDPGLLQAWRNRSELHATRREYAEAVHDLTKVIELDPNKFSPLFNRALCYESLGEYDKAIAGYSRILTGEVDFSLSSGSKEANLAHTYHYRGRAHQWYKQDHARAVADFTRALELNSKIEMVRYRRADAYHALKKFEDAARDYEEALKIDPNYPNLLAHLAWQLSTCPDPKFRDGKRAVELASKANDAFTPHVSKHMETLAAALAESGRYEEAIGWQKQAIEAATSQNDASRKAMNEKLTLYLSGHPYREK